MSRRQSHCFVPGCTTGYKSCKKKLSLFGVPKDEETYRKWQRNIPRADKPLERNAAVCELHFDPQFVSRHFEHNIQGEIVRVDRSRPFLKPEAIPTIFPNVPKYLSKPVPKKRQPKERLDPRLEPPQKRSRMLESSSPDQSSPDGFSEAPARAASSVDYRNIILPSDQWGKHVFSEEPLCVAYSVCLPGPDMGLLHAQKLVLFRGGDNGVEHQVFVRGVELSLEEHCEPASVLLAVDSMKVCSGAGLPAQFPLARNAKMTKWNESLYHTKCKGALSGVEKCCISCKYLRRLLLNQRCRARQPKRKEKLARKLRAKYQAMRRLRAKVKSLDQAIAQMKQENEEIEESALRKKIDKLPPKQKAAVLQCFEAANRKSPKGMRYNPEWLLECIIMRMKSPRLYEHVRREKILVLPSRTCLRKYMRQYESSFGFNGTVLSGIAKKTQKMTEFGRHGGIILDEMKLDENFAVAAGTGKIDGFVDLGPFTTEADKSQTCDHGLVIMFQPLSGSWHQILGVFASKGNVKAPLLSKIVMEAVLLAENAGLKVDYVTCDGASWNRAMWKKFGISATAKAITPSTSHTL
ncbi:uncharacterized protein LOC144143461 [Haemaphysalis longicornis]